MSFRDDQERQLLDGLRAVAASMEADAAPARVEAGLVRAFRRRVMIRRAGRWAAVGLAAALALVIVSRRPPTQPAPVVPPPEVEVATGFIPFYYAEDLSLVERGQIVRIRVPRSTLAFFGLPAPEERSGERIQADVLLGEDGLARAIRFVH